MFEVGKKYRHFKTGKIVEVKWVEGEKTLLKFEDGHLGVLDRSFFDHWTEYKEPVTHYVVFVEEKGGKVWSTTYSDKENAERVVSNYAKKCKHIKIFPITVTLDD